MANAVSEHGANNFATIRTTSIVTKQQKEHMQEEMHEQTSGYKWMRREHQAALVKLEEKCKVEMENHKGALDKEYDMILHNFTRDLDRLSVSWTQENFNAHKSIRLHYKIWPNFFHNQFSNQVKHQQELEKRLNQHNTAEKKLFKDITLVRSQEGDRKKWELNKKREYKANKERWKRELSMDDSTPKR